MAVMGGGGGWWHWVSGNFANLESKHLVQDYLHTKTERLELSTLNFTRLRSHLFRMESLWI